jgi:hypothetical protein
MTPPLPGCPAPEPGRLRTGLGRRPGGERADVGLWRKNV